MFLHGTGDISEKFCWHANLRMRVTMICLVFDFTNPGLTFHAKSCIGYTILLLAKIILHLVMLFQIGVVGIKTVLCSLRLMLSWFIPKSHSYKDLHSLWDALRLVLHQAMIQLRFKSIPLTQVSVSYWGSFIISSVSLDMAAKS